MSVLSARIFLMGTVSWTRVLTLLKQSKKLNDDLSTYSLSFIFNVVSYETYLKEGYFVGTGNKLKLPGHIFVLAYL